MTINVFGGGNTGGPAFPLQRSVRLRSSASAYFNRTPASAPTLGTKFTYSAWVKLGANTITAANGGALFEAGTTGDLFSTICFLNSSIQFIFRYQNPGVNPAYFVTTTQVFRDPSAWYHIVCVADTTQATADNRLLMYVNGVQVTAFASTNYPVQNAVTYFGTQSTPSYIGAGIQSGRGYFDGYMAEVNFIDGQALTPSSFGSINSTTGVWQPIKYTSTYGANGFYLNFQDNSNNTATTIGKDSSGNGNNWTPNNISVTAGVTYDSMLDVPTLTSATNANFPVLNVVAGLGNGTYSDGNLAYLNGVNATWKSGVASMGVTSGKYYFEYTIAAVSNSSNFYLGVAGSTYNGFASYLGRTSDSWAFQWNGASSVKTNNDVSTTVSTAGSISVNNVIQVAIDLGTGSIWWGRNNTWVQGDPFAGTGASFTNLTGTILPAFAVYSNGVDKIAANFGQRPFTYTPPTGFKSLNTYNLPAPTIAKGSTNFNIALDTGANIKTTGAALYTNYLEWIKDRINSNNHQLIDTVRGSTTVLQSNTTSADTTYSAPSGNSVGWVWNAGSSTVTNTAGTISSQVNANTSGGFSIVTYTGTASAGATVGHGLNIKPSLIIVKQRTTASTTNWAVYHSALDSGDSTNSAYLLLNSANAKADVTTGDAETVFGNGTVWKSPTSSVFTIGANGIVNASSGTYISYCFSEIAGYSKFGSYTGNGATNGPFVYLGFRPRWILYKASGTADAWQIYDTSRNTSNATDLALFPYATTFETDTTSLSREMDILSNGFKIRGSDAQINTNAATYIYAAFAESPFNYSLAR